MCVNQPTNKPCRNKKTRRTFVCTTLSTKHMQNVFIYFAKIDKTNIAWPQITIMVNVKLTSYQYIYLCRQTPLKLMKTNKPAILIYCQSYIWQVILCVSAFSSIAWLIDFENNFFFALFCFVSICSTWHFQSYVFVLPYLLVRLFFTSAPKFWNIHRNLDTKEAKSVSKKKSFGFESSFY